MKVSDFHSFFCEMKENLLSSQSFIQALSKGKMFYTIKYDISKRFHRVFIYYTYLLLSVHYSKYNLYFLFRKSLSVVPSKEIVKPRISKVIE